MINYKKINGYRYHEVEPGIFLPGVTSILSATADNKYLNKWKQNVGAKKAKEAKTAGIRRGNYTHNLVEQFVNHKLKSEITPTQKFEVEDTQQTKQYQELGRGILDYAARLDSFLFHERSFYNKLFAGTVDVVAKDGNKTVLIDWKTSHKRKSKQALNDYCLQLSAYRDLIHHNTDITIDEARIVLIYADSDGVGSLQETILTNTDLDRYYSQFLTRVDQFNMKQDQYLLNQKQFQEMPF
jgi:hypothetical protein